MPRFVTTAGNKGFDATVKPPWQMIGVGGFTDLDLHDGAGWDLRPTDPRISVRDMPVAPMMTFRTIRIEAKSAGTASIDAVHPDGRKVRVLDVEVKARKLLRVILNYVEDKFHNQTTTYNFAGFAPKLKTDLDFIFVPQTEVEIQILRERSVDVRTSVYDIVGRQDRSELSFTGRLRGPYSEWFKMADKAETDTGADVNVFLMPRSQMRGFRDGPSLVLGMDGNILYEDELLIDTDKVARTLGHWIAAIEGCSETFDSKQLMFRDPDSRGSRFIPKDCANILNPTSL
jgi:hypothetical protein